MARNTPMGCSGVIAGLAVLVASVWFVHTATATRIDHTFSATLMSLRGTAVDRFFVDLSALIRPMTLAPVTVVIALLLWRRLRRLALLVPLSFAVSIAMTYAVKWIVDKPRPGRGLSLVDANDAAFPSAHVAAVASTSLAVWKILVPVLRQTARKLLRWTMVVLIGLMALARVWVGAHWLSDVIGGLVVAGLGLSVALLLLRVLARQRRLVAW